MSATDAKATALSTGASAGIGVVYADRLARRGYDLILVARNRGRLVALAQRLRDEAGRTVETIAVDLNAKADLARIETTPRTNSSITLLMNNPGVDAPLLDSDVEKMDGMIRLNVGALARLTYAAVPGFVARGGTIIRIVCGGSKAFVLALSQSLRGRLVRKLAQRKTNREYLHNQRQHADLLQGLGHRATGGLQPRLAVVRGCVRRPNVLSRFARLSLHRT